MFTINLGLNKMNSNNIAHINPNVISIDSAKYLAVKGDQVTTTSRDVAEVFRKRHDDVLKKIKAVECSEEFAARNFAVSEYVDATGRKLLMYEITKDGFTFLAMGFTGKKAAQFKEAYINAFNQLEAELNKRLLSQHESKTLTNAQAGHIYNLQKQRL